MTEGKEDFTVSPSFTAWPFKSFKRFKAYADSEAGSCYWMAVDKLMERSKRLELLERELALFEEQDEEETKQDPNWVPTLGDD